MAAFGPQNEISFESMWTVDHQRNQEEDHDPRDVLKRADVVIAKDAMSGAEVIVWGRLFLEKKIETLGDDGVFRYLPVTVVCDFGSPELRMLMMLIAVLRGWHDVQPEMLDAIGAALAGEPLDEEFDETEAA
jgi:hypothetical protein